MPTPTAVVLNELSAGITHFDAVTLSIAVEPLSLLTLGSRFLLCVGENACTVLFW